MHIRDLTGCLQPSSYSFPKPSARKSPPRGNQSPPSSCVTLAQWLALSELHVPSWFKKRRNNRPTEIRGANPFVCLSLGSQEVNADAKIPVKIYFIWRWLWDKNSTVSCLRGANASKAVGRWNREGKAAGKWYFIRKFPLGLSPSGRQWRMCTLGRAASKGIIPLERPACCKQKGGRFGQRLQGWAPPDVDSYSCSVREGLPSHLPNTPIHTQSYTHAHTHRHMRTYRHMHTHIHTCTQMHAHRLTITVQTFGLLLTYTHSHTCTLTHAHLLTQMHPNIQSHMHSHTRPHMRTRWINGDQPPQSVVPESASRGSLWHIQERKDILQQPERATGLGVPWKSHMQVQQRSRHPCLRSSLSHSFTIMTLGGKSMCITSMMIL